MYVKSPSQLTSSVNQGDVAIIRAQASTAAQLHAQAEIWKKRIRFVSTFTFTPGNSCHWVV
jgi:hypothetical protein